MKIRIFKKRHGPVAPRPAGTYQCASPLCAWTWKHDGKGNWTGPSWPGHTGLRTTTWAQLEEENGDCAPRLHLVPGSESTR